MTLDQPGQPAKNMIGIIVNQGHEPVHIRKRDGLILNEVAKKKSGPSTARPQIRNNENIIGKNRKIPPRRFFAQDNFGHSLSINLATPD
jgi:hypothetical protein